VEDGKIKPLILGADRVKYVAINEDSGTDILGTLKIMDDLVVVGALRPEMEVGHKEPEERLADYGGFGDIRDFHRMLTPSDGVKQNGPTRMVADRPICDDRD